MAKTNSNKQRKPSQEVEIDHLLAEEFSCDPNFAKRFASACDLQFRTLEVFEAVPEPQLSDDGFGDLMVKAEMDKQQIAFLIEDKITAGAPLRQAERYRSHAEYLKNEGFERVITVLVAPASYVGERTQYDKSVNLEQVMEMLDSPDPFRLNHRRKIIERALEKKRTTGVKNPDAATHKLHSEYLKWAKDQCKVGGYRFEFPQIRDAYASDETWIVDIRHPGFPEGVNIRHRLSTGLARKGSVDLTIKAIQKIDHEHLKASATRTFGDTAIVEPFGKKKDGIQVSFSVPEMLHDREPGFCVDTAETAFSIMKQLTEWYLEYCTSSKVGGTPSRVGDKNKNSQRLVQKTMEPGTDHNSHIWILICERSSDQHAGICGYQYGANGTDYHRRKCPKCQDGADGFEMPSIEKRKFDA